MSVVNVSNNQSSHKTASNYDALIFKERLPQRSKELQRIKGS